MPTSDSNSDRDPSSPRACADSALRRVPWSQALAFWLKLGFISFGGPAGQIALMHEQVVERARWISEKRFLHALNYCMLLPGPEAQQLATYLGWLMHRNLGGILAGLLFVLPSFFLITLLAWAYLLYGHLPWASGLLDGIKPAVVALVIAAGWRIGTRTLRTTPLLLIALAAFLALFGLNLPFPLVIAVAALAGFMMRPATQAPGAHAVAHASTTDSRGKADPIPYGRALIDDDTPPPAHARPSRRVLVAIVVVGLSLWAIGWWACSVLAPGETLTDMAGFFTRAALLTFGGAYAVLPYVHQAAVEHYQWVSAAQMLDALALGETTPGPLIMIVAFVGFVGGYTQTLFGADHAAAAGWAAAAVATFFTFLPSFLFILVGGPLVESTRSLPRLDRTLTAITASVVGVIASLALALAQAVLWRGDQQSPDWLACLAAALAAWLFIRHKASVIITIACFGAAGMLAALMGWR